MHQSWLHIFHPPYNKHSLSFQSEDNCRTASKKHWFLGEWTSFTIASQWETMWAADLRMAMPTLGKALAINSSKKSASAFYIGCSVISECFPSDCGNQIWVWLVGTVSMNAITEGGVEGREPIKSIQLLTKTIWHWMEPPIHYVIPSRLFWSLRQKTKMKHV